MYVRYIMNQTQPIEANGPVIGDAGVGLRAAHVESTRRALLDTARRLFTRDGFQTTRTEEIAEQAGLTRGALYHHFKDKEALFRAVHQEVLEEVAPLLWRRSADPSASAWTLFRANSEIYLNAASADDAYRQIVIIDGPAVLGSQYLTDRGDGPTHKIAEYLRDAMDEGVLEAQPVEPLAHLLSALGSASAMYVAHADDPGEARRQISECYERLLAGLGVTGAPATPAPDRATPVEPGTTTRE
jgi:AcrR family transcriptional regulator